MCVCACVRVRVGGRHPHSRVQRKEVIPAERNKTAKKRDSEEEPFSGKKTNERCLSRQPLQRRRSPWKSADSERVAGDGGRDAEPSGSAAVRQRATDPCRHSSPQPPWTFPPILQFVFGRKIIYTRRTADEPGWKGGGGEEFLVHRRWRRKVSRLLVWRTC